MKPNEALGKLEIEDCACQVTESCVGEDEEGESFLYLSTARRWGVIGTGGGVEMPRRRSASRRLGNAGTSFCVREARNATKEVSATAALSTLRAAEKGSPLQNKRGGKTAEKKEIPINILDCINIF